MLIFGFKCSAMIRNFSSILMYISSLLIVHCFYSCSNEDLEKRKLITDVKYIIATDLRKASHEVLDNSTYGIGSKLLNSFTSKNIQDSILLSPIKEYIYSDLNLLEIEDLKILKLDFSKRVEFLVLCLNKNKYLIYDRLKNEFLLPKSYVDSVINNFTKKIDDINQSN